MKRLTLAACAGLLAAATALPSFAADMPLGYPPPPMSGAPFYWTGFYVGLNGGYGLGTSQWTAPAPGFSTGSFDTNGGLFGGTVGYNQQMGTWVLGLEGDGAASWMQGSDTATCGTLGCDTTNSWIGTVRARFGYAVGRVMPFVSGGLALGDIKMTPPGGNSVSSTQVGWTVGGGIEFAIMGAWSLKAEYLYLDLGSATCDAGTCGASTDVDFRSSIVRGGINYHF
jgi:outer membrane immunogenic protein